MARKLRDKVETKNIVLVPNTKDLIEPVSSFLQWNPSYSALEQDKHNLSVKCRDWTIWMNTCTVLHSLITE